MLNICVAHIQYIVNVNVHLFHLIHKYTADYSSYILLIHGRGCIAQNKEECKTWNNNKWRGPGLLDVFG